MVREFYHRTSAALSQRLTFAPFFFDESTWFDSFRKTVAVVSGSA